MDAATCLFQDSWRKCQSLCQKCALYDVLGQDNNEDFSLNGVLSALKCFDAGVQLE